MKRPIGFTGMLTLRSASESGPTIKVSFFLAAVATMRQGLRQMWGRRDGYGGELRPPYYGEVIALKAGIQDCPSAREDLTATVAATQDALSKLERVHVLYGQLVGDSIWLGPNPPLGIPSASASTPETQQGFSSEQGRQRSSPTSNHASIRDLCHLRSSAKGNCRLP